MGTATSAVFQKLLLTVHAVEHRRKLRPTVPVTHIDNADHSNLVKGISRFGAKYDSISMVLSNIEAAMNSPTHREFACALIIDTFGRFLLQQRDDIPSIIQAGKIGMFGGHREARESFLECVAREIREEISYAVPEHRFEYLATYNDADIDAGVGTLHGQFFILRDIPVDELVVTEGSLRIVTPDEISSLTNSLTPIAKMGLKAALEREREFGAELENHATNLVFDQMEKQRKKRPKRLDE